MFQIFQTFKWTNNATTIFLQQIIWKKKMEVTKRII